MSSAVATLFVLVAILLILAAAYLAWRGTYGKPAPQPDPATLQPHQQRVLAERDELQDRVGKLILFTDTSIYRKLEPAERWRLVHQLTAMRKYLQILNERIDAWGPA